MKVYKRIMNVFFLFMLVLSIGSCSHYWGSSGGISYSKEDAEENCNKYGKTPKVTAYSSYNEFAYVCMDRVK